MPPPRPTLGDIDLPPRRRLRDGSRSSSTSSRSAVVGVRGRRGGRGRGRSASTLSTLSNTTSALSSVPSTRSGLRSAVHSRGQSIHLDDEDDEITPEPELNNANTNTNDNREVDDYPAEPYDFTNSNFYTPPSPEPQARPRSRIDHGSTLIDMLDELEHPETSSSSSSNPNNNNSTINPDTGRRYTAAEKGKGKATTATTGSRPISISDEEEGDESIQVIGVKRKAENVDSVDDESSVEEEKNEGVDDEEEHRLGAYTCPVCFSEPTQAVITVCGHILCSSCLFSSLLAAIARNPHAHAVIRPKPKSRRPKKKEPQPVEWTAQQLQDVWQANRQAEYEKTAREAGMDEDSIAAGRDSSEVSVEQVLKGLWKIEQRYWVVEGECPVCRMGLPGGYGPDGKGIGGVIPLCPAVRSGPPPPRDQMRVKAKEPARAVKEAKEVPTNPTNNIRIVIRKRPT